MYTCVSLACWLPMERDIPKAVVLVVLFVVLVVVVSPSF